jgi:hypothetical protein
MKHSPAYAPDHRAIFTEKCFKSTLVFVSNEKRKQIAVGSPDGLLTEHDRAQVADDTVQLACRHCGGSCVSHTSHSILAGAAAIDPFFLCSLKNSSIS